MAKDCALHEKLFHELVQRSHERVLKVRTGKSSFVDSIVQTTFAADQVGVEAFGLPSILQPKAVPLQRTEHDPNDTISDSLLPLPPPAPLVAKTISPNKHSQATDSNAKWSILPKFQQYVASKSDTVETLHFHRRRNGFQSDATHISKQIQRAHAKDKVMDLLYHGLHATDALDDEPNGASLTHATRNLAANHDAQASPNSNNTKDKSLDQALFATVATIHANHRLNQYGLMVKHALETRPRNPHLEFLAFRESPISGSLEHELLLANENRLCKYSKKKSTDNMQLDADLNSRAKRAIHFGDQVCFFSTASEMPLCIGRNGHTVVARNMSIGPHMTFTICDFRNPGRHDEVTETDGFWLEVTASTVPSISARLKRDSMMDNRYFLGCTAAVEQDFDAIFDHIQVAAAAATTTTASASTCSSSCQSKANVKNLHTDSNCGPRTFKLMTLTADIPSAAYYGADKATLEYAIENNAAILRLARWQFKRHLDPLDPPVAQDKHLTNKVHAKESSVFLSSSSQAQQERQQDQSSPQGMKKHQPSSKHQHRPDATAHSKVTTTTTTKLKGLELSLIHTDCVFLFVNHFCLDFDPRFQRAVMREVPDDHNGTETLYGFDGRPKKVPSADLAVAPSSSSLQQSPPSVSRSVKKQVQSSKSPPSRCADQVTGHDDKVEHGSTSCCTWQVRLVHHQTSAQIPSSSSSCEPGAAAAATSSPVVTTTSNSPRVCETDNDWFRKQEQRMKHTEKVIQDNKAFVANLRANYDHGARESDFRVMQLERQKLDTIVQSRL